MNQINTLNELETKKILTKLNEQFGISSFPKNSLLAMRGKERIYLFTGNLDEKQIPQIENIANIEGIGVYFAKLDDKNNIRLTIEGTQLFKDQITKNIVELNSTSQAEEWMMGRELNIETKLEGFVIIKFKDDFLGCGKSSPHLNKITNFIPKARRLKEKN